MKRSAVCLAATLAIALAAAGCSGGSGPLPAAPGSPDRTEAPATRSDSLRLSVKLALKIPARHRRHRDRYLSPSTGSIILTVFDAAHTHQLIQTEINTVPGFNGCTTVASGTFTCPMTVALGPGTYAFDVATYDGPGGKGIELAALSKYLKSVVPGKANSIHLALYGDPVKIDFGFVGTNPLATGNGTSTFAIGGTGTGAAQQFQLTTEDADGNLIVGSGAPTYAILTNEPTNLTITPVAGGSGVYKFTPLHHTTVAMNLTMEAIPGGGVAQPIYASAQLSIDQVVYIANPGNGTVTAFAPWSASPVLTIPSAAGAPNPYTIALDSAGNLYVENFQLSSGAVVVFPPGSTTPSRVITGLTAPAFGLAVDSSGDVFVTEYLTQDVKEFTPSGGSTPSRILSKSTSPSGINKPAGLAVDAAGNLYVANGGGTIGVSVYAPGTSTTPAATFNAGMNLPAQLAFDAVGDLYVSNNGGNSVTEYAPPLGASSTIAHTFTSANTSTPFSIAVDGSYNVWVGQASGGHVVEFAANQSVLRTISGYGAAIYAIATDPSGNAFVADQNGNKVDEFSPASGTTPSAAYTTGVSGPTSIAVW
ncbi:MAG: hypothetical protein JO277_00790 [Candidatus Eremiobacteraeota bacterium]|nr:hypothetical protein [Candidatus Eremiobacteraeota bacterium]